MLNRILLVLIVFGFGFTLNPQPRIVTEKFFPDVQKEFNTPAFKKKRGFTNYEELIAYLNQLQQANSALMEIKYIGNSQKGMAIPMVVLTDKNAKDPIRVWMQGGLHGDEPASTEGMLHLIGEVLREPEMLQRLQIAVVPMANIDGYVKQDRYAANGLDLNRDQTKLMAPESVYLKQAFSDFRAEVAVDFHEYRPYRRDFVHYNRAGVTSLFDVMFLYSGNLNIPEELRNYTNDVFVHAARKTLDASGMRHHDYFTTADYHGDVHLNQGSVQSRSSATSYALSNCISSLIEVRGVGIGRTSFKRRVFCTYEVARSYLRTAYDQHDELRSVLARSEKARREVIVKSSRKVLNRNVAFIDLDTYTEVELPMVVHDGFHCIPKLSRSLPVAYALDANLKYIRTLVGKLKTLGVEVSILKDPKQVKIEKYIPTYLKRESASYEKVHRMDIRTRIERADTLLPAGTFLVHMNQKNAGLAAEVLEPEGPNSFISFGLLTPRLAPGRVLPYYRVIEN